MAPGHGPWRATAADRQGQQPRGPYWRAAFLCVDSLPLWYLLFEWRLQRVQASLFVMGIGCAPACRKCKKCRVPSEILRGWNFLLRNPGVSHRFLMEADTLLL